MFGAVIDESRSESLEICVLGKTELELSKKAENKSSSTAFKDTVDLRSQPEITQEKTPRSPSVHQSKLQSGKKTEDTVQDEFVFNHEDEQRGYFEKTERNEYQGEDLDVPTYLRRGIRVKLKV